MIINCNDKIIMIRNSVFYSHHCYNVNNKNNYIYKKSIQLAPEMIIKYIINLTVTATIFLLSELKCIQPWGYFENQLTKI